MQVGRLHGLDAVLTKSVFFVVGGSLPTGE